METDHAQTREEHLDEVAIGHSGTSIRWLSRVDSDMSADDEACMVVGHVGCLEFFAATFCDADFTLELEPNDHLPRID